MPKETSSVVASKSAKRIKGAAETSSKEALVPQAKIDGSRKRGYELEVPAVEGPVTAEAIPAASTSAIATTIALDKSATK